MHIVPFLPLSSSNALFPLSLCTYICEIINKSQYTHCHQLIIMQIKQQQSMVGLLICARSLVKFPNVLWIVHRAIRERSWVVIERGRKSERALEDRSGCHLHPVRLNPVPSPFCLCGSEAAVCLCLPLCLCPQLVPRTILLKVYLYTCGWGHLRQKSLSPLYFSSYAYSTSQFQ